MCKWKVQILSRALTTTTYECAHCNHVFTLTNDKVKKDGITCWYCGVKYTEEYWEIKLSNQNV